MRGPRQLRLLIAIATLPAQAACRIGVESSQVTSLLVRVEADPDTVALGDSTALTVRALNPTYDTVRFDTGGCDPLGIEIGTATGEVVVPATVGCNDTGTLVLIPPLDSIHRTYVWRGERGVGTGPLMPGVYRVRGFLNADGGVRFGDPTPLWLTAP